MLNVEMGQMNLLLPIMRKFEKYQRIFGKRKKPHFLKPDVRIFSDSKKIRLTTKWGKLTYYLIMSEV